MRKALGLLGDAPRHRQEPERTENPSRSSGSVGAFGSGLHRRRFVQDGDVPVTVVRREQGHDPVSHRPAASGPAPASNRLQRAESALAAETAAREKAERALSESLSAVRDLQTKIGHADLAKHEALDTLRREREAVAQIRGEHDALKAQLDSLREELDQSLLSLQEAQDALEEERRLRKSAEKAQKTAEVAREEAECLVRALSEAEPVAAPPAPKVAKAPRKSARTTPDLFRQDAGRSAPGEPEPVKWWLNAPPPTKRR